MTGHALDLGVVETIGRELVIRAHPFEHGGAAEDQIRLVGSGGGSRRHDQEQGANKARPFKRMPERPGKRDDMKFSGNKSPQCRHRAQRAQEGDGQAVAAAVYRSVRLFATTWTNVADGRTALLVNAYPLCETNV